MKTRSILAATALALGSASAQADIVANWGEHPVVMIQPGLVFGSFIDYYTFKISEDLAVSSTVVANNLGNGFVLNISGGQYSLWSMGADENIGGDDDMQLGGDWSFDGLTGNLTHTVSLSPGNYFYKVMGTGTGSVNNGGAYLITSTITPVPEAETWAMMLAGLGVLGFLGARRRRDD